MDLAKTIKGIYERKKYPIRNLHQTEKFSRMYIDERNFIQ